MNSFLFGKRICELRKLRGLTQEELAKSIKTNQSVISRIELGKSTDVSADIVFSLAKVLETSSDYLLGLKKSSVYGDTPVGKFLRLNRKNRRIVEELILSLLDIEAQEKSKSSPVVDDFNNFRFSGMNLVAENDSLTVNRISENSDHIVVRVPADRVISTKYGYALILTKNSVLFLKEWQVNKQNKFCEVLLVKEFFKKKFWGNFPSCSDNLETWEEWLCKAKGQSADGAKAKWI